MIGRSPLDRPGLPLNIPFCCDAGSGEHSHAGTSEQTKEGNARQDKLEMARAHEGTLDLLLTDVVMPNIRVPELAEILAREGKVRRAVLFSGYPEGMRDTGLKGLEAWELIPKPFTSRDSLAAVQRVLGMGA